ncbi:MAG: TolC family protein [Bacteroidetes bacterium]|nr:TolC family protein [Bacteroidota bacterium]
MKRLIAIIMIFPLLTVVAPASPRGEEKIELTLARAVEYAIENNLSVRSSRLDTEASKYGLWEAIAPGLPQVNGNASLNDNLKLMTTLLPGEFFGQPGEKIPVQFGSKYNTGFSAQASMLLFNGAYIVGIQTASLAQKLATLSLAKSELEIREAVTMSYYLILISEESMGIIDGNIETMEKTLASTRAMLGAGMAEETDVEQVELNLSLIRNSRSSMERNIEYNYNMMRFLLGVDPETDISLTDRLPAIMAAVDAETLINSGFNIQNNIDFRLINGQVQMSELAVKMQKSMVLPTLSTFYSYSKSGQGDKLNDLQWFPNSMLGFQLSVPIFASGERYARIKKANVNLIKAQTGQQLVTEQLLVQERQLRFNLMSANEQYKMQKVNIELAKKVYQSLENKYSQGMASSLELSQANANYLQAENNYVSALMSLLQAKTALDKLLGNL